MDDFFKEMDKRNGVIESESERDYREFCEYLEEREAEEDEEE